MLLRPSFKISKIERNRALSYKTIQMYFESIRTKIKNIWMILNDHESTILEVVNDVHTTRLLLYISQKIQKICF